VKRLVQPLISQDDLVGRSSSPPAAHAFIPRRSSPTAAALASSVHNAKTTPASSASATLELAYVERYRQLTEATAGSGSWPASRTS
jgi:hypothetical protein